MKKSGKVALVIGLIASVVFGLVPSDAFAAVERHTFIVQVQDGHSADIRKVISGFDQKPQDEITEIFSGFIVDLTSSQASVLRANPLVLNVDQDKKIKRSETQSPAASWGLDRIDQVSNTLNGNYSYPSSGGAGVRIYIVDSGVQADNPDFAGRILSGVNFVSDGRAATTDCDGHGTHVAGTAAGTKYGVAKKATIVPVRVLGCDGGGDYSDFFSGLDWIAANNPAGTPAIMSASLGSDYYQEANDAVEALYRKGIIPVIAAGNDGVDACYASPASAPDAITVGATDTDDSQAWFSNYGSCVDVYAPGVDIVSDNSDDPSGNRTLSGTSMATPHVAGLAALYLSTNRSATPKQLTKAIKAGGLAGVVIGESVRASNILINNAFTFVPTAPVTPDGLSISSITGTTAVVSWSAVAPGDGATSVSYKVQLLSRAAKSLGKVVTSYTTANTSFTLTGLKSATEYGVNVIASSGKLSSLASTQSVFTTTASAPGAPQRLKVAKGTTTSSLSWSAPADNGGAAITGYRVEVQGDSGWTVLANLSSTTLNYTVNTPSQGVTTNYRIAAVNSIDVGQYATISVAGARARR